MWNIYGIMWVLQYAEYLNAKCCHFSTSLINFRFQYKCKESIINYVCLSTCLIYISGSQTRGHRFETESNLNLFWISVQLNWLILLVISPVLLLTNRNQSSLHRSQEYELFSAKQKKFENMVYMVCEYWNFVH